MLTSDEQIGRTVLSLRTGQGLSQAQLAAAMTNAGVPGWHPQTVVRVERGARPLKLAEGAALARLFGVEVTRLFEQPESAQDDEQTLQAVMDLRRRYATVVGELRALRVVGAELEYLAENGQVSAHVAEQAQAALNEADLDAALRRGHQVRGEHDPEIEHIGEYGPEPPGWAPDPDDGPGGRVR